MENNKEASSSTAAVNRNCPPSNCNTVMIPFSRAQAEREIIADLMSLRDERNLSCLSPEERKIFTEEAIGAVAILSTEEIISGAVLAGPGASFSDGFWCKGAPGITRGVLCKVIRSRG
jgi:hypothetical protein